VTGSSVDTAGNCNPTSSVSLVNVKTYVASTNTSSTQWVQNGSVYSNQDLYVKTTGLVQSASPKGCSDLTGAHGCDNPPTNYRDFTASSDEWVNSTTLITHSPSAPATGSFPVGTYNVFGYYPATATYAAVGPQIVGTFSVTAPGSTPINGVCGPTTTGATPYTCSAGAPGDKAEYPNLYQWWCNGSNGGTNAQCTEYKTAVSLPTASITVNGSHNPITVPVGTALNYVWSSSNGTSYAATYSASGCTNTSMNTTGATWAFAANSSGGTARDLLTSLRAGCALTIQYVVFGLQATNGLVPVARDSVQINVASATPPATGAFISQSSNTTVAGNSYVLSWGTGTSGATSCVVSYSRYDASNNLIDPTPVTYSTALSGSVTLAPTVVGNAQWRLDCTGPSASVTGNLVHYVTAS
jgi:hypothetical protein